MASSASLLLSLVLLDASVSARAASLKSNELVRHTCLSDTTEECDSNSVLITEEDLSEQISAMMGHLRAGLVLFEIAEYGMGTPHLLHPIRETSEARKMFLGVMVSMSVRLNRWLNRPGKGQRTQRG